MLKKLFATFMFTTMFTTVISTYAADTTQPTAVDLSTPKAAVRTMLSAVAAADAPALSRVFEVQTADAHELLSAYADLIVSARHLRDAAREHFAEAGGVKSPAVGINSEDLAQVEAATVQIDGDRSVVRLAERSGERRLPIKLHRNEAGWQIDLTDYAGVSDKQVAEQVELNRSLATAMDEATDEITTGKYASAQEAESAMQQKIHAVIAHELKTSSPTANPVTTNPTTTDAATTNPATNHTTTNPTTNPVTAPTTSPE